MRLLVSLAAILLAGCSTLSATRDAWKWDPASSEPTRAVQSPEQIAGLTSRVADLQLRRNEIRARVGAEPEIWARQRLYADLHQVGRQLSPLERELASAAPAR